MLYSEWIRKTRAGALTPRSVFLRNFDVALKRYQDTPGPLTKKILKESWAAWKNAKGDFLSSVRNGSGAVTEMDTYISQLDIPKAPPPPTGFKPPVSRGPVIAGGSAATLAAAAARTKKINQENAEYKVNVPDATQVITYRVGDPHMQWDPVLGDYKLVILTAPTPISYALAYHFGFISRGTMLEVRVRSRLKGAHGYVIPESVKSAFRTHIQANWNIATLIDGKTRYDIRFELDWVEGDDGYEIDIDMTPPPPPGLNRNEMATHSASKTINMGRWGDTDRTGILHEFGHMIGNPDEYTCTSFTKTGHVWDAAIYDQRSYTTNSIMNNPTSAGRIHVRHFYPILMHYKLWQISLGHTPMARVEISNNISTSSLMTMAALNRRRAMGYDD